MGRRFDSQDNPGKIRDVLQFSPEVCEYVHHDWFRHDWFRRDCARYDRVRYAQVRLVATATVNRFFLSATLFLCPSQGRLDKRGGKAHNVCSLKGALGLEWGEFHPL